MPKLRSVLQQTKGIWRGMMHRCYSANDIHYHNYGGRGIVVCERWHTFDNFLHDMGLRPFSKASIDRINIDGIYEPANTRWATLHEQANNKSNTLLATAWGERKSLRDWAKDPRAGASAWAMRQRIINGMSEQDAVQTPHRHLSKINAFGETKSYQEWAADPRCKVSLTCLYLRIKRGKMLNESAITKPLSQGSRSLADKPETIKENEA